MIGSNEETGGIDEQRRGTRQTDLTAPQLFVLYTGGTIGMGPGPDGALVPLDLRELGAHLPFIHRLPIALTVATLTEPLDSAAIGTSDWLRIADAIVDHAPGHAGVVVLHGTDTMAYTASALSFLLEGIEIPIVLTGAQRPVTELRSDGRENLVTAPAMAAGHRVGAHLVPEVTICFDNVLLRGNRSVKVGARTATKVSRRRITRRWRPPASRSTTHTR